ncbi:MAG: hypothetical protein MJK07_15775 [Flavobacteriales bacterium]|nr:hypothetical protein [Flavobacteriales bacterium]
MTRVKKSVLTLTFLFTALSLSAQGDTIRAIPSDYIYPINLIGETLSEGEGYSKLTSRIRENQYILVGETHGVHESTVIIRQLSQMKKFDRFITEIDSLSMKNLLHNFAKVDSILEKMPGVYTMYSYKEELELLQALIEDSAQLEGIDLLHPAAVRLILLELSMSSTLNKQSILNLKKVIAQHNQNLTTKGYISKRTYKKTARLLSKLDKIGSLTEKKLIDYLISGSYPSNFMKGRAIYMRNRLMDLENNHQFLSENVLFKFGSSHIQKSINTAGYKDIGQYINQLGLQKSKETFFIEIVPVSGEIGFPFSIDGEQSKSVDFESKSYKNLFAIYSNIDTKHRVLFIDVEAFKESLNERSILSEHVKTIIDNYDGLIFIEDVTPSQIH